MKFNKFIGVEMFKSFAKVSSDLEEITRLVDNSGIDEDSKKEFIEIRNKAEGKVVDIIYFLEEKGFKILKDVKK